MTVWNPDALPTYTKWISVVFALLKLVLGVLGVVGSVAGSYRLLYYFITSFRIVLLLTLVRSIALPLVAFIRRDSLTNACTEWATANPSLAPQKPDCNTATQFATGVLATWASIEFLFELWVYTTVSQYRHALAEIGPSVYKPLVDPAAQPVQPMGAPPAPMGQQHAGGYGTTYGTYQRLP
ncbi:hypothetical protein HDV00_001233 [Rhizophlyctis rosea]|nr:hypothetical protein HDV00_001233 [Rhizophlyctis rosea]